MAELTPVTEKFILLWGEMGSTWGINRATAQIAALLYLSPEPLTAEQICETLSIARSTVSSGLRELQNWGIIKVIHVMGDRRDHFETLGEADELLRAIMRQRKSREVDPLLNMLRQSAAESNNDNAHVRDRIKAMLDVLEVVNAVYDRADQIPTETLIRAARQINQLPMETLLKVARLGDGLGALLKKMTRG
jgi:DNA-binding transcriptional regulator GbsR (MarR family)